MRCRRSAKGRARSLRPTRVRGPNQKQLAGRTFCAEKKTDRIRLPETCFSTSSFEPLQESKRTRKSTMSLCQAEQACSEHHLTGETDQKRHDSQERETKREYHVVSKASEKIDHARTGRRRRADSRHV